MNNVVPLPGAAAATQAVGHYVRLGDTEHKILESVVADGRFPADKVVVDASRYARQSGLIAALRATNSDVESALLPRPVIRRVRRKTDRRGNA